MGVVYAILCAFTWSLGTIFFRKSTQGLDSTKLTLLETSTALLLFLPIGLLNLDEKNLSILYDNFFLITGSGVLGLGFGTLFYFYCLKLVGASILAVIECLYLPFTIILATFFLAESITPVQCVGVAMVISSILFMNKGNTKTNISMKKLAWGMFFGALAQLFMASSATLIKPVLAEAAISSVMILRLSAGLIATFLFSKIKNKDQNTKIQFHNKTKRWNFFLGVICISFLSPYLWLKGLQFTTVTLNSILVQSSTIFTIILARILLGEHLSLRQKISSFVAVSGVLLSIAY